MGLLEGLVEEVAVSKALVRQIGCLLEDSAKAAEGLAETTLLAERALQSLSKIQSMLRHRVSAALEGESATSLVRRRKGPAGGKKRGMYRRRKFGSTAWSAKGKITEILEDGHSWRKYGQKPIHGSKHPRSYYRCSHKYSRGCKAMRHAQRMDENPAVYVLTYFHEHTCMDQESQLVPTNSDPLLIKPESTAGGDRLDSSERHEYFTSEGSWPITPMQCSDHVPDNDDAMSVVHRSSDEVAGDMDFLDRIYLNISDLDEEELGFFHR